MSDDSDDAPGAVDSRPFVDPASGSVDVGRIIYEARPIAELALLFALLAAAVTVPVWVLFDSRSLLGGLLVSLSRLILTVGVAITALYVLVRARQLAGDRPVR